jgi:hypothetical protein
MRVEVKMKRKITVAALVAALLITATPADASDRSKDRKSKRPQTVTITEQQFMTMLQMIADRPSLVQEGKPGQVGADGKPGGQGPAGSEGRPGNDGKPGAAGQAGSDGQAGSNGRDGADGRDGSNGRDGVGFAPGTVFLVNGGCPDGTTVQGAQNRWTVYANDTSGRPWTTSGSSAQLFLSACQVD